MSVHPASNPIFRCPNPECGGELIPAGVSVAWPFGGAEKLYCKKCNKYYWYVEPDTTKNNGGFYLEGDKNPYDYCKEKGLLHEQNIKRRNRLDDFMRVMK